MNDEKKKFKASIEKPSDISPRRKFIYTLLFVIGLPLSYPTVFPFGLVCSTILLFQKNKTLVRAGFFLVIIQFLVLILFGFIYAAPPIQPYAS